jgi:hypothetical protein
MNTKHNHIHFSESISEQLKCFGCSACGVLTSRNGTLTDGSGTSDYANNMECEWLIAPYYGGGAAYMIITFTELSTQKDSDYVRVFHCSSTDSCPTTSSPLYVLSGMYTAPRSVAVPSGLAKVTLTSDSSVTAAGFAATWNAYKVEPIGCTHPFSKIKSCLHKSASSNPNHCFAWCSLAVEMHWLLWLQCDHFFEYRHFCWIRSE